MNTYRQEVFNVLLAQLLQEKGIISAPEKILRVADSGARRMPDVLVEYNGLRLMIEGEVDDQDNAVQKASDSATNRVEEGIAHIGVAIVYPKSLRQTDFAELKEALSSSTLQINVITESGQTGYFSGDLNRLKDALVGAFEDLLREDVVAKAVSIIDIAVDHFAMVICDYRGPRERFAKLFGFRPLEKPANEWEAGFSLKQLSAASRIGGLIIINAMISQDILANHHDKIASLRDLDPKSDYILWFKEQWQIIIDQIDYYPIFHLAIKTILKIGNTMRIFNALEYLAKAAMEVVKLRAALRHDLMGRIYHRLLSEAKYLGTYYTSIPAATLLLKLALRPSATPIEWHDLQQISRLRIADPSCGTGTLLMAAAEAITDNHFRASALEGEKPQPTEMHKLLTEEVLYGYDVLASAIHLTASTLALKVPDVPFKKMNLFSLPLGGEYHRLGSLEFLEKSQQQMGFDLFGAMPNAQQATSTGDEGILIPPIPDLDLCVMNPPFTRSVGGNLLFGSVPDEEREPMQKKLQKLVKDQKAQANITAGLGSVFIAIADRYVKQEGRIALILPKALLSGVSWSESRELINKGYHIEYIITSQDPQRWNFSESTDLSEVMMVMRKSDAKDNPPPAVVINLWRNPTTIFEALTVASEVMRNGIPDLFAGQGGFEIVLGNKKLGEAVTISQDNLKAQPSWLLPCAFAQIDLTRAAYHLQQGQLHLPGQRKNKRLALCPLGELGTLGSDARDIHDGFKLSHNNAVTAYSAFWGHDSESVLTLEQESNAYLTPLPKAKPGRRLKKVEDLWELSGRLLIAERLWLNTQKAISVRLDKPVIASSWWTFNFTKKVAAQRSEKVLAVWLNSTLGILTLIANRVETRGAWVKFKKPTLAAMPVLNIHKLTTAQLKILTSAYDKLCNKTLKSLPEMAEDPVRAEIDKAIAKALNLPDFSILRTLLAKEPVVCLKSLSPSATE